MPDADIKELRVKIDMSYHLKLHALKLLRNKKMSEAVEEALDLYFAEVVGLDGTQVPSAGRTSSPSPQAASSGSNPA